MNLPITYKIDISKPLQPTPLTQMLICQDKNANTLAFELYDGETPLSPGGSCAGYAVRADGHTVPMTGTVDGNIMSITLPEEAYAIEGPINIAVKNNSSGARTTVFFGVGTVLIGQTGATVNPGDVIPDITELMAALDQMEQATAGANAAAENANSAAQQIDAKVAEATASIQDGVTQLSAQVADMIKISGDTLVIAKGGAGDQGTVWDGGSADQADGVIYDGGDATDA